MDITGPVENGTVEEVQSTSSAMSKTTTISTIAVQSGATRIVIALLHVGVEPHFSLRISFIFVLFSLTFE